MTKKKASRKPSKRTGILVGLIAVGVTAGAVGAMAARRRSRSRWEEYESGGYSMAGDQAQAVLDSTRSAMDMAAGKTSGSDTATASGDQPGPNGKDAATPPRPGQGPEGATDKAATDKAATATKNSRG